MANKKDLTNKLCLKYPELEEYKLNKGRFDKRKRSEIFKIINSEEKDEFMNVFYKKNTSTVDKLIHTSDNLDEIKVKKSTKNDKEYIHSKGQYFTKNLSLKKCVIDFIKNKPDIILEPSIGRGDLVDYILMNMSVDFDMCEIDKNIKLLDSIDKNKLQYGDFMKIKFKKYDTIIGNPPYVKTKKGNLYIDFIEKCYNLLNDKGELIFIVPSDFFKLTSSNELLSDMISMGNFTHIYHPHKENLFENASIDVIVFRYCKDNTLEKTTLYNNEIKFLIESSGLITFSNEKIIMDKKLSDYFEISVGMVCGRENVYRNKEIGNLDLLSGKDSYTKYIYIDKFPSDDIKINEHLLKNKDDLINRRIRKFNENNWFEWGAPRNINKMKKYKGQDCIYVKGISRSEKIAFIGKVDYFGGLIMMRPIKKCNLEKVVEYLNSDNFKKNFMYSGRFKIGQGQLCNSYFP